MLIFSNIAIAATEKIEYGYNSQGQYVPVSIGGKRINYGYFCGKYHSGYKNGSNFENGRIIWSPERRGYYLFDKDGNRISKDYDYMYPKEDVIIVKNFKQTFLYGMINYSGVEILPLNYDYIGELIDESSILSILKGLYKNGVYYTEKKQRYGVVDSKGNIIMDTKYLKISAKKNGYSFITEDWYRGFADLNGKIIRGK